MGALRRYDPSSKRWGARILPNTAGEDGHADTQYEDLLRHVLDPGARKQDRTGTGPRPVFGHQLRYRLSDGFPLKSVHARFVHNDRPRRRAVPKSPGRAVSGSPGARAYYDQQRTRGLDHQPALRQLANRLVGILHGCLRTAPTLATTKRRRGLTHCGEGASPRPRDRSSRCQRGDHRCGQLDHLTGVAPFGVLVGVRRSRCSGLRIHHCQRRRPAACSTPRAGTR
jgi:hypothetical protein